MNHGDKKNEKPADGGFNWELPADLQAFETQLKTFRPRPDGLDRDRLIFFAGRASMEEANLASEKVLRQHWALPVSFSAMTAVAATLLVMLLTQPDRDRATLGSVDDNVDILATIEPYQQPHATERSLRNSQRHILTSAPCQLEQLEHLLASDPLDSWPDGTADSSSSGEWPNRKILTPTSIHMLFDEPAGADVPSQKTSYLSPEVGAYS